MENVELRTYFSPVLGRKLSYGKIHGHAGTTIYLLGFLEMCIYIVD